MITTTGSTGLCLFRNIGKQKHAKAIQAIESMPPIPQTELVNHFMTGEIIVCKLVATFAYYSIKCTLLFTVNLVKCLEAFDNVMSECGIEAMGRRKKWVEIDVEYKRWHGLVVMSGLFLYCTFFVNCIKFQDKAPLSKSLLIVLSTLAFILAVPLRNYQIYFIYNLQAIKQELEIWRLISARIICLDVKDVFCSCLLIYNFRIFERRYGSQKFASFLLGSWVLSTFFDFLLVEALKVAFDMSVNILPSGFLGPVFALFVPFYLSIPRVQVTHILGRFAITNKTLVYILGLQLLTSSTSIWIVALSGLMSGIVYHNNVLEVQKLLSVPTWVARTTSLTLEPVFSSTESTSEAPVGMGATLDIQRQQRMEQLDQQMMLAQLNQTNRRNRRQNLWHLHFLQMWLKNMKHQCNPLGDLINWNRFFPSLRNRFNANNQRQETGANEASGNVTVSEEQVTRLMEMGFSRIDALEALRATNNDLNMATNILLQH